MRYINYLEFSVYHIMLFLSLAENLNYTRTAEKCGITQSSLSRIILQLEQRLGIQLFIRSTTKVALTPAGKSMYKDMKSLYGNIEQSVREAYRIQQGKSVTLNIGIADGMDITVELLPFLREFQEKNPQFEISITRDFDMTLMKKLKERICDVVFDLTLKDPNDDSINGEPLFTGPLVLYMLKTNRLCEKEELSLADIRSQALLVRTPSLEPGGFELVHNLFSAEGIEPLFSSFVVNAQDMCLNITQNNQGILADRYFVDRYNPNLCGRPIAETECSVWVRWLRGFSEGKDTDYFIETLFDFFAVGK